MSLPFTFLTRRTINSLLFGLFAFFYSAVYYLGMNNLDYARAAVSLDAVKPFVYRQFVPLLARFLAWFGLRIDIAIVILMTAFGIGFYIALIRFASFFYDINNRGEIIVLTWAIACLALFGAFRKPYDLATAFLFTLALFYISKRETRNYLLLFPLVCLNRETAFLLIPIFFVFNPQNKAAHIYQVMVYALTTIILRFVFADNSGAAALIEPVENLWRFINDPTRTLFHLALTALLLWAVLQNWSNQPAFLRAAFLVMFPFLMLAYFVFGQAYETRVFWELVPVGIIMIFPVFKKYYSCQNSIFSIIKINPSV